MAIHNADIAARLDEIADLLEIEGANVFRVRAYRNAARTVRDLPREVTQMLETGASLTELSGIGKDLAGKIEDIACTGTTAVLEEHRQQLPPSLAALLSIPGLGPKRVKTLYDALGVRTLEEVAQAARDGRIRTVPRFGKLTERHILEAIQAKVAAPARFKLATAAQYAESLVSYLKQSPGVLDVEVAGSYRRSLETVGDLDILVTADADSAVMDRLVSYSEVKEVLGRGPTKTTLRLLCGLQVDVRVVHRESYGSALVYFTGSKAHNIVLRQLAQQRGFKLNEYGVFIGSHRIAGTTEESVYQSIGLPWIPPELRENRGELEAAQEGRLPKLVALSDVKGDLHVHTNATDGRNSLQEMVAAARDRGFHYVAITDHSKRLGMARGLDANRLLAQIDEIDRLQATTPDMTILKGIEVDILEGGLLDLADDVLGRLDLVIGAVHSHFDLSWEKQTERILRAMERPHFSILAHPSGRLIHQREPYEVDMARIIRHARERRCFLEINSHPERLDLADVYCQMAKEEGVLVSVNSDAHSVLDLGNLRFGIGQARRGWLEKADVVNTRALGTLRRLLAHTM